MYVPVNNSTASSRFAIGPAATIAILFQTRLPIERTCEIRRGDGTLALVEHLDVAAERHRGDRPLGAVGTQAARPDDATEPHGEAQDLDAASARDPVVAELVEYDEHAQNDEKCRQLGDDVHQAAAGSFSHARATARASTSAASASSSVCTGRAGSRASASAQAGAMSV